MLSLFSTICPGLGILDILTSAAKVKLAAEMNA